MIKNFKIEVCRISELEEIIKIEKSSFPNKITFDRDYFLKMHFDFPGGLLVAKKGEEILGYGIGKIKKEGGKIISLAVKERWRRKGIGKKLLENLLEKFKEKKVKSVFLHVREKNKVAILFYKKLGFEIFDKKENYYLNGENAYLMKKNLKDGRVAQ